MATVTRYSAGANDVADLIWRNRGPGLTATNGLLAALKRL
jgi:hypothetical protein